MSDTLEVVDLFAGAGGLSTGVARACEDLGLVPGEGVALHAINHWEPAIETHEANHPWADHYHAKIEELHPPDVAEPGSVSLLTGGPECTHFSTARGGKPVTEQKRASAWHVLDWIEKLRPDNVLLENVPEFRDWGPIVDGEPTRDGSIFERWIGMLEALGYAVSTDDDGRYGVVLNAADYGDPQSRRRLFILASRTASPTPPEPTHDDEDPDKPDRRVAADIIDWSDPGSSIWTRDLELARVQPLSKKTMARIAEGIRRHCDGRLAAFADAIERIGPDELEALRETVVPVEYAGLVAEAVDRPFLVRVGGEESESSFIVGQHSRNTARSVYRPVPTVSTVPRIQLCDATTVLLRQQDGAHPVAVDRTPTPTIAGGGAHAIATVERSLIQPKDRYYRGIHSNPLYPAGDRPHHTVTGDPRSKLVTPYLCPLYPERASQSPRTRGLGRPLMTVPASKSPAAIASPFIVQYYGNSDAAPIDAPIPTVTARDRFALCVPEAWPWGLDVRYRMLQPDELKQAQGFPPAYEIAGDTKRTVTKQIGNAVPVNLSRALCRQLLEEGVPSLAAYGGGLRPDPDAEVPEYAEVIASDD